MTNANNLIKISGYTYTIFSLFFISFLPALAIPLLAIGIILLANSLLSLEDLQRKRTILLIIAIISIIFNQLAAVLLFISFDEISSAKPNSTNSPPKDNISADSKRIDILLKIGLVMVLISGILFATTSWEFITDPIKLLFLIIMGVLFLGLSIFSEKVLKIESTTKGYFMLGLAFLVLTFIGIGYFAPYSTWFSYAGEGSNLVYAITYTLIATAFYLVAYKFKDHECKYLAHTSSYLAIFMYLSFASIPAMAILLIMTSVTFLINIFCKPKKTSFEKFSLLITYMYFPLIIMNSFDSNLILLIITCIINILDMLLQATKTSSALDSVATGIISFILIILSLGIAIPNDANAMLITFMTISIIVSITKYTPLAKDKALNVTCQVLYHLVSFIIVSYYLFANTLEGVVVTFIYLIISAIGSLNLIKEDNKVDFFYQPIIIFYFVTALLNFISKTYFEIPAIFNLITCGLIYTIIDCIFKSKKVKEYYLIYIIIATILSFLINIDALNVVASIILVLESLYIFLRSKAIPAKVFVYIFILLNLHILAHALLPSLYANILILLVFGLLTMTIKEKRLSIINYLSFTIPLLSIIQNLDYRYYVYKIIAINILILYVIFLIIKYLISDKKSKDILATVFYSFFTATIIFSGYLEVGIYIGLLALIIIFVIFNDSEYKRLFYTSIVILIINIITQLWDYWGIIPFWIYLLLVGLSIIIFATYKELNKDKKIITPSVTSRENINLENQVKKKQPITSIRENIILAEPVIPKKLQEVKKETVPNKENSVGNFCPSCGTPNKQKGNFCKNCGRNLVIKK